MKKNWLFVVVFMSLIIAGCSAEKAGNQVENSAEEDHFSADDEGKLSTVEVTDEAKEEEREMNGLILLSHVEQLGSESFTEIGLARNAERKKNTFISEKEGFTYVYSIPSSSSQLVVSIIDNVDFIVKEKSIDLTTLIGENNSISSMGANGNSFLFTVYPKNLDYSTKQIQTITVDQNGDVVTSFIDNQIPRNTSYDVVQGLDGSYFKLCENKQCTILDVDGTNLFSYSEGGSYPSENHHQVYFFDEHTGRVYFREASRMELFDKNDSLVTAYDLVGSDLNWDDAGAPKSFNMQSSYFTQFIAGDGGYYTVMPLSPSELQVSFYTMENDDFVLKEQIDIPMTLEIERGRFDIDLALGEQSLNVYVNVLYKGQPTIQKYMFSR